MDMSDLRVAHLLTNGKEAARVSKEGYCNHVSNKR